MKKENISDKELTDIKQNNTIEESSTNDLDMVLWLTIIFLIFAMPNFEKSDNKLDRNQLINNINNSDLSNSEKKRIIEILLG